MDSRHAIRVGLLASAMLMLAACGGGGGSDGGTGTTPPPAGGSTTPTYTIGGSVAGLAGNSVTLQNNGGDSRAIIANGAFTFATAIASGATYTVTVATQPSSPSQQCTVTNASGTATANVTNVTVTCVTGALTLSGTVSGLQGSGLQLKEQRGEVLDVVADGTFSFATPLASGTNYTVTVERQPSNPSQACTVTNGAGTLAGSNITNIAVSCVAPIAGGSSFDKIQAALDAGTIDANTALQYKLFAQFKDARLPAQFAGDNSQVIESDALDEVYERWDTLPAAVRTVVEPFLIPPAYVGSWASPAAGAQTAAATQSAKAIPGVCQQPTLDPNWGFIGTTTVGSRVKVWYDGRVAGASTRARTAFNELENNIWPKLVSGPGSVGLKEPLSDGASAGCNGGDGRLDVYFVNMGTMGQASGDLGETFPATIARKNSPTFILISQDLDDNEIKGTLAHEFTHASQWAYPVAAFSLGSYDWLKDATAQAAIDVVYPTLPKGTTRFRGCTTQHFEQCHAHSYFTTADKSIDLVPNSLRPYGTYVFFQFIARTVNPQMLAKVWESAIVESDQAKAVDRALKAGAGGFKEQWPKFAKALWNQDPVAANSFDGWESLKLTPTVQGADPIPVNLHSGGSATWRLDANMPHLSMRYWRFRFNDPNVRSVSFLNNTFAVLAASTYQMSTQAFFYSTRDGLWKAEHWSDEGIKESHKAFCFDVSAERMNELVIVMSNDHVSEDMDLLDALTMPRLSVSNVGCWRYEGNASVEEVGSTAAGTTQTKADATIELTRWRPPSVPDGAPGQETFELTKGAVTGDMNNTIGSDCTVVTHGSGQMSVGLPSGQMTVHLGVDLGGGLDADRQVGGTGTGTVQTTGAMTCNGTSTPINSPAAWNYMLIPIQPRFEVKPDGTIQGTHTENFQAPLSGSRTSTWRLTPQRQP